MIKGERKPTADIEQDDATPKSLAAGSSAPRPTAKRSYPWKLGTRAAAILLAVIVALDIWAIASTDPDYYLPDFFRPLGLALIALFIITGWIRFNALRRALRTFGFVSVIALLAAEANMRFGDANVGRVEVTDDVLLRYRYRPGHEERVPSGPPIHVNHLGLLDLEHAIPKPKDVLRVAVLTGSIANDGAIPFEDRFFRRLEHELAGAAAGKRIETINVSCEGYNTLQQVRLLEKVGLLYEPDVVVVGYMLSAAAIQNGGYRRFGNSFFLFRLLPLMKKVGSGSFCSMFEPLHQEYTFDLVVRNSFERLALLRKQYGFHVLVAALPVVEQFDDPVCSRIYDQVVRVAREAGLDAVRVPDAFVGQPVDDFAKPDAVNDVCHPNPAGHHLIASTIAASLRPALEERYNASAH